MNSALTGKLKPAAIWFQSDRYVLFLAYTLVFLVVLAPLTVIDVPFLADYPNHLARMHILGNVHSDIFLAERYATDFDFIPNLAMDLIVPWLSKIMPLDAAGRLFLALTLFSTLASVLFLHRVLFNHWSLWPMAAGLLLYHGSFMAGMINFSLGVGLVPGALALWIAMRHAPPIKRIVIGTAITLVMFFCHLIAFGAYGLMVIAYESVRARDKWSRRDGPGQAAKDFLVAGVTGLIPMLLFIRQLADQNGNAVEKSVIFGSWSWKAKALLSPLANYQLGIDLASFALLAGLAVWGWRSGFLEIERRMRPGLGLLILCFVLAPKALWTGGVFDQRFVIIFALILIGSTEFRVSHHAVRAVVVACLAALFLVRIGWITKTWTEHRDDLAEIRSAIAEVKEGSRILVVQPDKTAGTRLAPDRHIVFHHAALLASFPLLAVIDKSSFVSTIYAIPGQHPLRLLDPFDDLGGKGASMVPTLADLAAAMVKDHATPQIRTWWRDFDYVVLIYGYGSGADTLKQNLPLETLMDGQIIDLFRITGAS